MAVYSFFGSASPPAFGGAAESGDSTSYTLGLAFETLVAGTAKAARFYWPKVAASTLTWPVKVGIWERSTGKLLAEGTSTITTEPATNQWVEVAFSSPPKLESGVVYVVGYLHKRLTGNAGYWVKSAYFTASVTVEGIMVAPKNSAVAGGNGRFHVGAELAMPAETFGEANYGVDVVFEVAGGGSKLTLSLSDAITPAESRGKRDAVKRADALSSLAEGRVKSPRLSKHDSQALADAIRRSVREQRKDTVALAEILKKVVGDRRADNVALADHLARALGIHKKDAFSILEVMKRRAGVAKKDAVAPVESHKAAAGRRLKDSSAPTDALRRSARASRADGLLLAELLAHAWHAKRKLADTIPLDDDFLVFLGQALEMPETVALGDHLLHAWAAHSGLADHIAPTEARKLRAALKRADTAAVVAVIHNAAGPHRHDSFALADARRLAARKGIADHIALQDAIRPVEGLSLGNSAVFADAVKRAWAAHLKRADTFALTDVARRAAVKHLVEHFALGDLETRHWHAVRHAADVFSLMDSLEAVSSKGNNPRDHAVIADAIERAWVAVARRAESLVVSDHEHLGFAKFAKDGVHVPDVHLRAAAKHFANQIALTEHLQRAFRASRHDAAVVSDVSSRRARKPLQDAVSAQDGRSSRPAKTFLEAALHFSDAQLRAWGMGKRDHIAPADARRLGLNRPLQSAFSLGDRNHHEYVLRLRDAIMPLDYRTRRSGLGKRETMSLGDAINVLRVLGVLLDDALEIADGLRKDSVLALVELQHVLDHADTQAHYAHLAILTLVDFLQTQTSLDDAAELLAELSDRSDTYLSVEDGSL